MVSTLVDAPVMVLPMVVVPVSVVKVDVWVVYVVVFTTGMVCTTVLYLYEVVTLERVSICSLVRCLQFLHGIRLKLTAATNVVCV